MSLPVNALDQRAAYEWLRNAVVGERIPGDMRLEFVTAMAMREMIFRHEKLCEAVLGILTDEPPTHMSNADYRQLLREQVALALNGLPL